MFIIPKEVVCGWDLILKIGFQKSSVLYLFPPPYEKQPLREENRWPISRLLQ